MSHTFRILLLLVISSMASNLLAHSGRTDSSGGHNCSPKSISKGLCSGYHYHNKAHIDQPPQADIKVSSVSNKVNDRSQKPTRDNSIDG